MDLQNPVTSVEHVGTGNLMRSLVTTVVNQYLAGRSASVKPRSSTGLARRGPHLMTGTPSGPFVLLK